MKLSAEQKQHYTDYMAGGIEHVIKTFDKRPPASKGERDVQNYFADQFRDKMDTVKLEDFQLNPGAFMGWIYISATSLFLALICYFFIPLVSTVFFAIAVFCMLSELFLYKEWLDPLFPEKTSVNLYATKAPVGEVKRRIVLCGHADAAYEWHWHYKFGVVGFMGVLGGTLAGAVFILGAAIAKCVAGQWLGLPQIDLYFWLGIANIPFALFYAACYAFSNGKRVCDGANDNLTACYEALAAAKALADNDEKLENTEFCVLISGSEEAGLRGSRAFCRAHAKEWSDVETIVLCFETLRDEKHLSLYKSEIFGFYKTDLDTAKFVAAAGKEHGRDIPIIGVSVGTDSAAFGEYGIRSTCLAALDEKVVQKYYHTRLDSYDNINPPLLGDVLEIALTTISNFDRQ